MALRTDRAGVHRRARAAGAAGEPGLAGRRSVGKCLWKSFLSLFAVGDTKQGSCSATFEMSRFSSPNNPGANPDARRRVRRASGPLRHRHPARAAARRAAVRTPSSHRASACRRRRPGAASMARGAALHHRLPRRIDRHQIGLGVLAFVRVDAEAQRRRRPRANWRTRSGACRGHLLPPLSGAGTFELQVIVTDLGRFRSSRSDPADLPNVKDIPHELLAGRGQGGTALCHRPPAAGPVAIDPMSVSTSLAEAFLGDTRSCIPGALLGDDRHLRRLRSAARRRGVTGAAAPGPAKRLAVALAAGPLLFYLPLRARRVLGLSPSLLARAQAVFAIACIVAAYAVIGPARAARLRSCSS